MMSTTQITLSLTIFLICFVGNDVYSQYFDPNLDDKAFLDNVQQQITFEVTDSKTDFIEQAKVVDDAARRFVAAQLKENLFIALRVLAERELREIANGTDVVPSDKKPKQEGVDDDDDGDDGGTTRRPNNIIPQVAGLLKAVFGGSGNINLTSYVEAATKLLPRPVGNQVLGFVKLLSHNPRDQWTSTTPKGGLVKTTTETTRAPARSPVPPVIVILPPGTRAPVPVAQASIISPVQQPVSIPVSPVVPAAVQTPILTVPAAAPVQQSPLESVAQISALMQQLLAQKEINNANNAAALQSLQTSLNGTAPQGPVTIIGPSGQQITVPAGTLPSGLPLLVFGSTAAPATSSSVATTTDDDDDDDDYEAEARQLNLQTGLTFLGTLLGGRPTTTEAPTTPAPAPAPVANDSGNSTDGASTRSPIAAVTMASAQGFDIQGIALSVRNGLGDLIKVMPDLFRGAREGFRLIQTISSVFGALGGAVDIE